MKKFAAKMMLLAITMTAGCNVTLNGQMPVTANANFDTKIGEQPAATQSVAVKPSPEATPTKKVGTLIIAPDYATVDGSTKLGFRGSQFPLWSGFFSAHGATIILTELSFEVTGTAPKDDAILVDIRLVGPKHFTSIPKLSNGIAKYSDALAGLETIKEDGSPINLQVWPLTNISNEVVDGFRIFYEFYNNKTIGITLDPAKVKTLNNDTVVARQSLSFEPKPFCCYSR